jgi:hypothetical protein
VSATNGHGHSNIALSWEQDFDWNGGAAAAGHEWSQDDWEENVGAAAAANNLYKYREERNAAAAAHENHDHGDAYRWNGADWNDKDWENQDLPLVHPVDRGDRDGLPLSIHSSLPLLESVPPTPSPSPPPSPPPLQLQFIPHGDAGPTYAIQVGPSLRLQPVEQRVTVLHQLQNVLVLEEEEEHSHSRQDVNAMRNFTKSSFSVGACSIAASTIFKTSGTAPNISSVLWQNTSLEFFIPIGALKNWYLPDGNKKVVK